MGENTNQIEQEIRERRSDLGRNLNELEDKARDLADWRKHYRDHQNVFLGAALGAGLVVGLATIRRSSTTADEVYDTSDETHDPYQAHGSLRPRNQTVERAQREFGQTWNQIAGGLLALASAKVIQLVSDLVPGLHEHLDGKYQTSKTLH